MEVEFDFDQHLIKNVDWNQSRDVWILFAGCVRDVLILFAGCVTSRKQNHVIPQRISNPDQTNTCSHTVFLPAEAPNPHQNLVP